MKYGSVVGEVPEDLRGVLTQPLPERSAQRLYPDLKIISAIYKNGEDLMASLSARGLDASYAELFRTVTRLGSLTLGSSDNLRTSDYFRTDITQGPNGLIVRAFTGWHTDKGLHQGRLIVSDRAGTLYGTPDEPHTTPDFGILKLSDTDPHSPNKEGADLIKTRLMITVLPDLG